MSRIRSTFRALRKPNYRRYFIGNGVSATGEWMQKTAQAWLVLELSGSGTLLGVTAALQHLPVLLMSLWGGLLADRLDKRRVLFWTEGCAGGLALLLGLLIVTGVVELWMVMGLAVALGTTKALDRPAKKSFVFELVGPDDLPNAVALNSVVQNAAKVVGPSVAGILIAAAGLAPSFFANAASYLAVLAALALMRTEDLERGIPAERAPGQLREGFRYVRRTPQLLAPLLLMAVSGLFAYEWNVTIPLLARETFEGDAQTFGVMFSAMGIGAVAGGLAVAGSLKPTIRVLIINGWIFSFVIFLTAAAPTLVVAIAALVALGGASIAFRSMATSFLQLQSVPQMRGRVTALLGIAFSGTTPLGGPLAGWIAEVMGARFALAVGGVATLIATIAASWYMRRCANAPSVRQL